jgi:hypothetical protein
MEMEILAAANVFILAIGCVAIMSTRAIVGFYARTFILAGLIVCAEIVAWRAFSLVGGGTAAHLILSSASVPLGWAVWLLLNSGGELEQLARRIPK